SRRRHTRFSRDWSSDVCSSDLELPVGSGLRPRALSLSPSPQVGEGNSFGCPAKTSAPPGAGMSKIEAAPLEIKVAPGARRMGDGIVHVAGKEQLWISEGAAALR